MRLTVEPAVVILRTIPTTTVIPPLIFVFGLGNPLKIFAIVGDVISHGQHMFFVVESYAWIVVVAALGFFLNALFRWAERRSTFWVAPSSG
jgi:ABC-type nitrate/sulfonate/bicarbonate transport system permease component